jgi:hypothetical protein
MVPPRLPSGKYDPAKMGGLRTGVEIFDLQTDTTFVSVPRGSVGNNSECGVSASIQPVEFCSCRNFFITSGG